jgi:hypothetical protein
MERYVLYSYDRDQVDSVTRDECTEEQFDLSTYVGDYREDTNLYNLYRLDGYTNLQAAIKVLELRVQSHD